MKLSEQVDQLERRVSDLGEQVAEERRHKHLMIDRKDQWHGLCASLESKNYDLRERLRKYETV